MECPRCKEPGAYTGLQWVHCQNAECYYYDARYVAKLRAEKDGSQASFYDKVEKLILLRGEIADDDS